MSVTVSIAPRGTPDEDRARIVPLATGLLGPDAAPLTLIRRCSHCGGAHGRPSLVAGTKSVTPPHASLSRAGDHTAIAVSTDGPVGVDIESVDAVAAADLTVFAEDDLDGDPRISRALAWTAKEAVLKAAGVGLREDPEAVVVRVTADGITVTAWPRSIVPLRDIHVTELADLPGGLVGVVAVFAQTAPPVLQNQEISPEGWRVSLDTPPPREIS